ncbi:2-Hydroxyacid oxidase 2-like [Rhipicephalus sanguineus]|uniref:2-Hydroxyacid oxidase 2-like n=1 Tax=Rhipicephalus sanguineus TaxID=34632 RepID=UPI0020C23DD8|nr:2-Hydroxyacid oxidase 2-like [Rhipicephalus sanguineus]
MFFPSPQIDVLPEIVAAVGDKMEVYLDSGVRTGADVVKALALGARAVFVGRPVLWGLAYDGKHGVRRVLRILRDELEHTMRLLGCSDVNDLCEDFVVHESWYPRPLRCTPGQQHNGV